MYTGASVCLVVNMVRRTAVIAFVLLAINTDGRREGCFLGDYHSMVKPIPLLQFK
jgi:hypothetical protein